jgi:hypothetical protein
MIPDTELRRLFRELARTDETSAPSFRELRARARASDLGGRRNRSARLVAALALVGALAVALSLLFPPRGERPGEVVTGSLSLSSWSAPTDFLLETPGRELLDSTPRIGVGPLEIPTAESSKETKGTER